MVSVDTEENEGHIGKGSQSRSRSRDHLDSVTNKSNSAVGAVE